MKINRILAVCIALVACDIVHAAELQDYTIAAPSTFAAENFILQSAIERGSFEKAGIRITLVPVDSMDLVAQSLAKGNFDAHVFPAPAWHARYKKVTCSKMVMPLAWLFYGAIVANVEHWKDLVGGTVIMSKEAYISYHATVGILAAHGVPEGSYTVQTIGGFTQPRMRQMLSSSGPAATVAFDPLLEYIGRTDGVHVLSDVGEYPVVSSGLMVRCDDLQSPDKRALHRRVVTVLFDEASWILDAQQSDASLLPWTERIFAQRKYDEKYGLKYEGKTVRPSSGGPAAGMITRVRKIVRTTMPSERDMRFSLELLLPPVGDPTDYYDFGLLSQAR